MPRAHRSTLLALFAAAALAGVFFGALAATPATTRAGRLAGISGPGVSGIQIVNLSPTSTMTAVLDAYKQGGGAAIPIIRSGIAPLAAADIFLPNESSLRPGAYAGILSSDQPHAVIGRAGWPNSGGSVMFEGATAAAGAFIPVVYRQYAGQTSMVSIQNTDTSDLALVNIEVRAAGSATVVADRQVNIAPGTSVTLDLAKDPGLQALPPGFVGTMHVSSQRPGQLIAVNAIVDVETSPHAVYAFGGDNGATQSVFVPRFRVEDPAANATVPAKHTTLIAVANPLPSTADFKVTYTGLGGSCAGQVVVHGNRSFAIPGGSNLLFDPGPGGAGLTTGPSGLPAGCFGSAKIEAAPDPSDPGATVGAAAVAVDFQRDASGQAITAASAYNAFKASDAATKVISPHFRRQYVGMSTELTVMNLGPAPANVTLNVRNSAGAVIPGCGAACQAVIAPGASHTFQPEDTSMSAGAIGSAVIDSDQPVVAIVEDVSREGTGDRSAFRAIGMTQQAPAVPGAMSAHSAIPWLSSIRSGGGAPTSSPAPTSAPGHVDIFAIGFVDVSGGADPACPGCNSVFDPEDQAHATQHPLPSLTFVLRDDQGDEVTRTTSTQLATLQRAMLRAPELTGTHYYTLELVGDPAGYQLCSSDMRSRQLTVDDFQLGSTREDFHFNTSSCVPDPNITPVAIPTATPGPSATPFPPGTPQLTIFAVSFVDVFGGSDPSCPGCDREFSPEDEAYASQHPLSQMTFIVRNSGGQEIARQTSEGLATLQRAQIDVPMLAEGEFYTLELLGNPAGWQLCANESRTRRIEIDDFQLDSTREDFHFNTNQCSPWPTATVPSQTVVHRYSPSDDSRVASASPDSNYGDTTYLRVRQAEGDEHRTYLMFNVENLAAPIVRAKIRLFAYDYGVAGTAAASVHVNWAEDTITWNNAPALGALLDSAGPVAFSTWAEYNVTSVIHPGNGTYAFAIVGNSQDSIYFRSKEYAGSRPELVIETAADAVPTATVAPTPAPVAGPKGRAVTGVSVVNLDPASTGNIQAVIKHQETGASTTIARPNISPQGSTHVFLPSESGVIRGLFAGLVNSDVPVRAIVNNYWLDEHASAYSEDAVPAADVLVPLVVKGADGQNSLVTIQNYDTTTATDVEIKLSDTVGQVVATVTRSVAPGASITLDIGRDPAFLNVPLGFVGSLRARAALRIAAQSIVDVEHSPMAVYGFQGEPAVAAADTLFVPRAQAGVPVDPGKPEAGLRMTRIAAANPGTSAIAVTLTFAGADGTCGATAPAIGPASIAAGGMRLFDLSAEGLPAGCTAAVQIDATGGGVLAVVVDTVEAGQFVRTAGAYNAFTATQGGTRTMLPVVRKRHVDGRFTTDIAVMNVSSDPATVTLSVKDYLGRSIDCPADCEAVVAPGTTHTFVPESISGWQAGIYGSAVVESDQPVVVTVTDESRILTYDTGIYRGAAVALTPSDIAPSALALPLLANQAQIRLDGPALTPPDPGWINLPSLVEPLHTLFLPIVGSLLDETLRR